MTLPTPPNGYSTIGKLTEHRTHNISEIQLVMSLRHYGMLQLSGTIMNGVVCLSYSVKIYFFRLSHMITESYYASG
jgi:hypothetical protein